MTELLIILIFFVGHWFLSAFHQTFFLHRYASHQMFTLNRFWERFFYFGTFATQGSSFLNPRAYAILHRMHHAHSDTEKDPHSPHFFSDVFQMMWYTKKIYEDYRMRQGTSYQEDAKRFEKNYPEWPLLDRIADAWVTRAAWCGLYIGIYVIFAPSPWFFLLLPIHFLMGPVHGAAVNWCGHKYGYRNYKNDDHSKNTTPFDLLFLGELFQNNHHRNPGKARFAQRWWEVDPVYPVIRLFSAFGILKLKPKAVERSRGEDSEAAGLLKSARPRT